MNAIVAKITLTTQNVGYLNGSKKSTETKQEDDMNKWNANC